MFLASNSSQKLNLVDDKFFERLRLENIGVKNKIIYEQPLNERMRSWLRLEYLFNCVDYRLKSPSDWDSRSAVEGVLSILEFILRNDIKAELIKDLEYQLKLLSKWQQIPDVNNEKLEVLLEKAEYFLDALKSLEGQFGFQLQEHYLFNSVRQRLNIPGGTCRFDLPAYYHWSQKNPKSRHNDLLEWLAAFFPLREANELNLYLLRQNALPSHEIAVSGLFQAKLAANTQFQIIRVTLPHDLSCYPEISGGKHRITLRFFEHKQLHEKPTQTSQDISFELCCCGAAA